MAPHRLTAAALGLLAAAGAWPAAAEARQDVPPTDTAAVASDTTVSDTVPPDTAAAAPTSYPDRSELPASRTAAGVRTWSREDLLDSSALSLQDFLLDHAPGVLPLRAGFFFGPHQLRDGPWGAGGVHVVVDGRELPPLASGQADLSRISLASVERLRLVRRAGETVLHVTTLDHDGGEAYSRISAGTGQPGADGIRGLFTNTAGDDFTVHASVDHLNVGVGEMPGNRLDAWAKVSWMPSGGTGLELVWRAEGLERTLRDSTAEIDRSELLLHARSNLTDGLQAEVWAGRTSRDPRPDFFPDPDSMPGDTMPPDTMPPNTMPSDTAGAGPGTYEVEQILGSLTYRSDDAFLRLSGGKWTGRGAPELTGRLHGSLRLGPIVAEAGVEAESWPEISTTEWSGGLAYRPAWWEGTVLRLEAATGSRGSPRPGRTVDDSLVQDYDALSASAEFALGPYRIDGTVARRTVDRQLPFGGFFDRALPAAGELSVTDLEARVEGPPIPFGFFADHVTARGFWRRSRVGEAATAYYLPETLIRGEGVFRHTFFDDNLELRLVGRVVRRGEMATAVPGESEPVALAAETTFRSEVLIRIDTFRIWWRTDNLRGARQQDFGELVFPASRNVFGIRWEFFD